MGSHYPLSTQHDDTYSTRWIENLNYLNYLILYFNPKKEVGLDTFFTHHWNYSIVLSTTLNINLKFDSSRDYLSILIRKVGPTYG